MLGPNDFIELVTVPVKLLDFVFVDAIIDSMSTILIRDVSASAVKALKKRARKHNRSLQAELKEIIEQSACLDRVDFLEQARRLREELMQRGAHSDSTNLIREDRQR